MLFLKHYKHTPASKLFHMLFCLPINVLTPDALMALTFMSSRFLSIQLQSYLGILKGLVAEPPQIPKNPGAEVP